ncbi:response regulator transcription factor [Streptomyces cyaneofuscatus]|uniref:response regulator transcription factor n=1 Tax=Streptomyces cyaneofuscatus TaxID=66883 RepID=UPI00368B5E6C
MVESLAGQEAALAQVLRRHGHEVHTVRTGEAALSASAGMDIVLLDLELPDLDGLGVCKGIRARTGVPIIAVTALGTELDRVLGLNAGADDYIVKPYGFRELMARMCAVMRRADRSPSTSSVLMHGPLSIDTDAREVTLHSRPIALTRKEFDLLAYLAARPGSVVPRRQLLESVWAESWSRRTVDTHISSVRNKLGSGTWIITVRGVGYRLGHP